MGGIRYLGMVAVTAVRGAWDTSQSLLSALAAALGAAGTYIPSIHSRLPDMGAWQAALGAFIGVLVIRLLFIAPYELWKRQTERADLAEQATAANDAKNRELDMQERHHRQNLRAKRAEVDAIYNAAHNARRD